MGVSGGFKLLTYLYNCIINNPIVKTRQHIIHSVYDEKGIHRVYPLLSSVYDQEAIQDIRLQK